MKPGKRKRLLKERTEHKGIPTDDNMARRFKKVRRQEVSLEQLRRDFPHWEFSATRMGMGWEYTAQLGHRTVRIHAASTLVGFSDNDARTQWYATEAGKTDDYFVWSLTSRVSTPPTPTNAEALKALDELKLVHQSLGACGVRHGKLAEIRELMRRSTALTATVRAAMRQWPVEPGEVGRIGPAIPDLGKRFKKKADGTVWEIVTRRLDGTACSLREMRELGGTGWVSKWVSNWDNPRVEFTGRELFEQFDRLRATTKEEP